MTVGEVEYFVVGLYSESRLVLYGELGRAVASLAVCMRRWFLWAKRECVTPNVILDEASNILSIIDWEGASTAAWEVVNSDVFVHCFPHQLTYRRNTTAIDTLLLFRTCRSDGNVRITSKE